VSLARHLVMRPPPRRANWLAPESAEARA
jgi:hypothetical protein